MLYINLWFIHALDPSPVWPQEYVRLALHNALAKTNVHPFRSSQHLVYHPDVKGIIFCVVLLSFLGNYYTLFVRLVA